MRARVVRRARKTFPLAGCRRPPHDHHERMTPGAQRVAHVTQSLTGTARLYTIYICMYIYVHGAADYLLRPPRSPTLDAVASIFVANHTTHAQRTRNTPTTYTNKKNRVPKNRSSPAKRKSNPLKIGARSSSRHKHTQKHNDGDFCADVLAARNKNY